MLIDFLLIDSVCCTYGQTHWLSTIKMSSDYENEGCSEPEGAFNKAEVQ